MDIWGVQTLAANAVVQHRIGPLLIWLERSGDELHYAFSRKEQDVAHTGIEKPGTIEWNRWVCGNGHLDLILEPVLPPRPVVVRPVMPVQILPGQRVRFFVSIPVYVAGFLVEDGSTHRVTAFEEPSVVLSNSWYGKPADGTLCYALRTRARRTITELRTDPHLAICPLELLNEAQHPLLFERLLLRSSYLGLYQGQQHIWASGARLVYAGEDSLPEFQYLVGPPSDDAASVCLAAPRDQVKRGVFERAMSGIRGIGKVRNG